MIRNKRKRSQKWTRELPYARRVHPVRGRVDRSRDPTPPWPCAPPRILCPSRDTPSAGAGLAKRKPGTQHRPSSRTGYRRRNDSLGRGRCAPCVRTTRGCAEWAVISGGLGLRIGALAARPDEHSFRNSHESMRDTPRGSSMIHSSGAS